MEEKKPRAPRGTGDARQNGRASRKSDGSAAGEGSVKKTRSYKHVQLEHERPQLTKAGSQGQGGRRRPPCP